MENEHIVDEKAIIKNSNIVRVYEDSINWLQTLNANIVEFDNPVYIKATHKGLRPFYEDWRKIIIIRLEQNEDDVSIHVIMDHGSEWVLKNGYENRRRSWNKILESLWKHIGVDINEQLLKQLYPDPYIKKIIKDHQQRFLFFIFCIVFMLIMIVIYPPNFYQALIPIFLLSIVVISELRNIFKWRKKMIELKN